MTASMSLIPTAGTRPEIRARATLRLLGLDFLTNVANLPGSPDIVLPSERIAVFVHGCFWHRHCGCQRSHVPATAYPWSAKFARNQRRDQRNRHELLALGYRVLWLWECGLTGRSALPIAMLKDRLAGFVASRDAFVEIAG